ncbi:uncharacterized protein LOC117334818 isoform X2 [Pecten maximus]|uniref:uncharacterized protein LOC117334818 isoform X2 n=1 Tax=Pecten maximus TaxID=6579 RepID=UPI00145874F9|nr:uncharacterized protein LOC117334818 isoform X2 [Pecten maximus]XP_033750525.1 uncharacterized protein LOC117334818 isoform X2 [Pecten maximus]
MGCGGSKDTDESAKKPRTNQPAEDNVSNVENQTEETSEKKSVNSNNNSKGGNRTSGRGRGGQSNNAYKSNGKRQAPPKSNKGNRQSVNEKGYKKRIREQLWQATDGKDELELENAIAAFEKNKLQDNGDLTDAKEKLAYLNLRKEVRDAILRRHPGVLDKAIQNVEESPYQSNLQHYLDRARELRHHLTELDTYRHDILEMDQATISEIRSYHHPPDGVRETMMSTYLILGYEEDKLMDWSDIQCLLGRYGKESLMREVKNADTVNMTDRTVSRVDDLQSKFTSDKIRAVSCGAATFYVWNNNMCDKFSKDNAGGKKSTASNEAPVTPASTKERKKNKG